MRIAGNLVVLETAASGHHRAVEHERRLVKPEALQSKTEGGAEVRRETRRQHRRRQRGEKAEPHEEDQDKMVVPFKPGVGSGVEVEQKELGHERRCT